MIGQTSDEMLGSVFMAANINKACGGAVIAPWNVAELPDEWIEACLAATVGREQWKELKRKGGIDG